MTCPGIVVQVLFGLRRRLRRIGAHNRDHHGRAGQVKYVLQPDLLSPPPAQPITEDYFQRLKAARATLITVFDIEESFDLLVGNFLAMEGANLQQALSRGIRSVHDYDDLFELKAELSRHIVNLLSSARMFVDTLPGNAARCGGDMAEVKKWLSAEYDCPLRVPLHGGAAQPSPTPWLHCPSVRRGRAPGCRPETALQGNGPCESLRSEST